MRHIALLLLGAVSAGTSLVRGLSPTRPIAVRSRTTVPIMTSRLYDALAAAEQREEQMANSLADMVAGVRSVIFDAAAPLRGEFKSLGLDLSAIPNVLDFQGQSEAATIVGELRDILNLALLQERVVGAEMLGAAAVLAVIGGIVFGDRTRTIANDMDDEAANSFRTALSEEEASAFDAGVAPGQRSSQQQGGGDDAAALLPRLPQAEGRAGRRASGGRISVGVWLELALCIALDAGGMASLFYPSGEAWDIAYSFVYALFIELFFDWPALALFALWEELLPFVDFVPTATIGWLLVIVLGLRPATRDRAALFRGPVDTDIFSPGTRPPLADRRSYMPTESYLVEDSTPWEE